MSIRGFLWCCRVIVAASVAWFPVRAGAAVNLELRPGAIAVAVGDTFEVTLAAVSDNALDQTFVGLQAGIGWDPSRVEFLGLRQLCPPAPCPEDTYGFWMPSSVVTFSPVDGTLGYVAFGPIDPQEPRPVATPLGLRVVAFRFRATASGRSTIQILPIVGTLNTNVDNGGVSFLGTIGPPSDVVAVVCGTPEFAAAGSRYLRIVPAAGSDPIALRVTGELGNPDVECVLRFVQATGRLGENAVRRTPDEWGTILLTGEAVVPEASYDIRAECGSGADVGAVVSPAAMATTWVWGDVSGDQVVDTDDLFLVLNAAGGNLPPGAILQNLDQAPCVPDGVIDDQDVLRVRTVLGGIGYPCFTPCEPGPNADSFGDFVRCFSGPDIIAPIDCVRYDATGDARVDLADFSELQFDFGVR